jgi:excisionase family DNA binding protein
MSGHEKVSNNTLIDQLKSRKSFLSTTEARQLLGSITRQTLCAWVNSGTIPAIRIGNANMFDPVELARWLEERHL